MIILYIYRAADGMFLYQATGGIDGVINDLQDGQDFTLTALPDHQKQWYWYNNCWNDSPAK